MALSTRSQLAMLDQRHEEAIELGTRAERLAREIGDRETVIHALTNVGTTHMQRDDERGPRLLEEAFALAAEDGHDDHAARALVNFATAAVTRRRSDPRIPDYVERALAYVREHELDGYVQYLLGVRATLRLYRGAWAEAEADARASIAYGEDTGVSLCPALIVHRAPARAARRGGRRRGARRRLAARGRHRRAPAARARRPRRWPSTRGWRATSLASPRSRGRRSSWPRRAATRGRGPSSRTGCGGPASRSRPRTTTRSPTPARWRATGRAPPAPGSGSASPTTARRR